MKNTLSQNQNNFDALLEEMNQTILHKEMADIVEVTYAYADLGDGRYVNKVLFGSFLSSEYKGKDDTEFWKQVAENIAFIGSQTKAKLLKKNSEVISYIEKLQPFLKEKNPKAQILFGSLEYISKIIDLTITGLPFELEKAGLSHGFSADEVEQKVQQLEKIETELFGGNVRENFFEVQGVYDFIAGQFSKNKELLTPEEQTELVSFMKVISQKYNFDDFQTYISTPSKEKENENPIRSKDIKREDYVKIFEIIFSIYGLTKPVIIDERSSIYDADDGLHIPNTKAYETLKLSRVLALIQHEIETHYLISENNKKLLGNFRGAGNLQREEGLAMQSENFLAGKNFEDLKVSRQIPDILMGEILSGDDYKRFMVLYTKLKKEKNAQGNYIRRKRNYPLNYRGVQHKDTSYNRGEHKVVDFIKNGGDVKDLYFAKVSFDDIEKVKDILQNGNQELKYPLLLGEIIQYVLLGNKLKEKEFWQYLEKKYPFLNIRQEIAQGTIKRLTKTTKGKINTILKILK